MQLKRTFLTIATVITLSFQTNAYSEESLNSQFKTAYYAYQDALKSHDQDGQFKYAEQAYHLGEQLYGQADINTANLGLILAQQHLDKRQKKQANSLLLKTLDIFTKEYGKNAIELAEIYLLLGKSTPYNKTKLAIDYHLKALDIAEVHEQQNPHFNAQIQLDVGIALLSLGSRKSKTILTAQEFFSKNLPADDRRVVSANFYAGKYYLSRKKYTKAIDNFRANLPVFAALDGATHPFELTTHAFLINALERSDRSDEATQHCIAIGAMTPWDDNQEQQPLFRIEPKYPVDYARKGKEGWVQIGFTVSGSGTVTEPKILDSKGGRGFEKASLAALEKWRYAPKFEAGKPTTAYASVQLDFKMN